MTFTQTLSLKQGVEVIEKHHAAQFYFALGDSDVCHRRGHYVDISAPNFRLA